MSAPVKFFTDEKGKEMVQMTKAHYEKISGKKKDSNKDGTDKVLASKKKGLNQLKAGQKDLFEKPLNSDLNLLDTDEQCKRMKNEIRKKFNEKSEVKVEYLI
ncbi:MAG: hypothetical protein M9958_04440 [Chitinophagales bacterium]|nr:hypothetical protein [Chitinophagales bacterium]